MPFGVVLLCLLLTTDLTEAKQGDGGQGKKTYEVQGIVVEAGSQSPVPKALVVLSQGEEPALGTHTDEGGNFAFHSVVPGAYVISAERGGYVADPKLRTQPVTVGLEEPAGPVTLHLIRTGAVSGHVLDADGAPITGASVELMPMRIGKRRRAAVSYAVSDDRGAYRAYNIPPGRYKLLVTYSPRHGQPVRMQHEKDKSKDIPADTYGPTYYPNTLDTAQAAAVQIDSGGDLQGMDIGLQHTKAVRVRGRVSGPDDQITPLMMVILAPAGMGEPVTAQVRPDGSFELNDVAPGKYSLGAAGFLQQGKQLTANQPLEVGESDVDGVQLLLGRAQSVTGVLVTGAGRKLPPGLMVVLEAREPAEELRGRSGGFAQVNENGTFALENVAPGDYDLIVGSANKGDDLYVSSIRAGDADLFASGIHIGAAAVPAIEVTIKANGATIDVKVVDEKGTPVPEARVLMRPDPPRRSQPALRAECQADASGKCTLSGIAPGDYHAFAFRRGDSVDFRDPETVAMLKDMGTVVSLAQGEQKSVKLTVTQLDDQ